MTDLEITQLCAEAMGLATFYQDPPGHLVVKEKNLPYPETAYSWRHYDPIRDDAQAMALVKKFHIFINHSAPPGVEGYFKVAPYGQGITNCDADLNRAICECVAKMQTA